LTFATLRGVVPIASIGVCEVGGFRLVHGGRGLRSIHLAAFMRRAGSVRRLLLCNELQRAAAGDVLIWMRRRVRCAFAILVCWCDQSVGRAGAGRQVMQWRFVKAGKKGPFVKHPTGHGCQQCWRVIEIRL